MLGAAYGLEVESDSPIIGVDPGRGRTVGRVRVERLDRAALDAAWRPDDPHDLTRRPGVVAVADASAGFRLDVDGAGTIVVSEDGGHIAFCPGESAPDWVVDRLLTSDALPLAALSQGIEALHAGAIVIDGRVLAVSGRSGAGKSTLALHLARRGHRLLADDVTAIGAGAGAEAHPAVAVANVRDRELRVAAAGMEPPFGRLIAEDGSAIRVLVDLASDPAPIGAVYLLDHAPGAGALELRPEPDPARLMAATFNVAVRFPRRLAAQIDAAARITAHARIVSARIPPGMKAPEVAAGIEAHFLAGAGGA